MMVPNNIYDTVISLGKFMNKNFLGKLDYLKLYYIKDAGVYKRNGIVTMNMTDKDCRDCDKLLRNLCMTYKSNSEGVICHIGCYIGYLKFNSISLYTSKYIENNKISQ